MNDERVRELFSDFAGEATAQKFACRIIRDLHEDRALRYWQQQIWTTFVESHAGVPAGHEEIRKALSWCYIHETNIVHLEAATWVPRETHKGFRAACESSFPFCYGNHVCLACVAARDKWIADHPFVPKQHPQIDWSTLESTLFDLALADIAAFAKGHAAEVFYGFAFDCNADYGQAMPCLNTTEFHQAAIEGRNLPAEIVASYEQWRKQLGLPAGTTPSAELRWSLGDWKYQDFSSSAFKTAWERFERQVHDAAFPDVGYAEEKNEQDRDTQERFLESVCRVVVRLEKQNAFDGLKRTDDFRTYVADHDEDEEESWERLNAVRNRA